MHTNKISSYAKVTKIEGYLDSVKNHQSLPLHTNHQAHLYGQGQTHAQFQSHNSNPSHNVNQYSHHNISPSKINIKKYFNNNNSK